MKKLFLISALLTCWQIVIGQQVSGTITDDQGVPLIGATIMEKGTDNGTITDIDGNFSFDVNSENPILEVSFIGYGTQEVVYDGSSVNVALSEGETLDEVVVVGYGVQKKKVVTGSIAKVGSEEIEDKQVTRLEQALQGRTSGVSVIQDSGQPGASSRIRIRGKGTLGDPAPLYIVDGVPIGGGIDYLSPNDIESIEVLKDASASIYGTRAANGVIIVTTKNGAPGMKVDYAAYYGVSNIPRKLNMLNATEYAIIANESSVSSGGSILFSDPQSLGQGTDWQDLVARDNAPMQNHVLSISAGGRKSTYYASIGFFDQQGVISAANSKYKRLNAAFNARHKVTDKLTISTNMAYARVNAQGISANSEFGGVLGRALNLDPITPLYETDPEELAEGRYLNENRVEDQNGVFGISPYVTSEIINPVAALSIAEGFGWSDKIVSSAFAEYEFIDGLKFKSSIGLDLAFWGNENFTPVHYLNATNLLDINSYSRGQNRGLVYNWENLLSYEKKFNNHELGVIIGNTRFKNSGQGIGGSVKNIPVDNLEDASFRFATPAETQTFGGFEYDNRLQSVFARLNYNYSEKYMLTAIMRRDGSSRFGENNKYGYFPSVSVGWNMTDEDFFPSNAVLKYLKVRASWGLAGNDRFPDFRYLPLITTGASYTIGDANNYIIGASPDAIANKDLRWEESEQYNIGLDMNLFSGIEVNFDVYRRNTSGILQVEEVPGFVGFNSPWANVSDLRNEGVELELNFNKDISEDFSFSYVGNFSYNRNEILFITKDKDFIPGQRFGPQGLEVTRTSVGLPADYIYGYKTDGIFQNQAEVDAYVNEDGQALLPMAAPGDLRFVDIDGDGDVDEDDRTFIGDGNPNWVFGSTIDLQWKNFDFSIFAQGVAGNEVLNMIRRFDLGGANFTSDALERWTGEGTSNSYPRITRDDPNRNFSRSSDFYVENGAYLRLRNVQFGYKLPETLRNLLGIGETRFYISLNNLYTFTGYSGYEPEIIGGIDRGQYPNPRTFLFGVNVNLVDNKSEGQ